MKKREKLEVRSEKGGQDESFSVQNSQCLIPRLRFPEFRGDGGWGEKTIGQVCKSFSGGTPNTSQKEYYGGSIPFIRSAEIDREDTELFLTEEGLKNSAAKLVAKGDVLVALYGANSGDVALARINGAINQAILCLKSEVSNRFIHQFLSLRKSWIITTYLQGGQGNLSGEIVKSISLGFPTLAEQQKIAECLSSVDEAIAAQARKLDALKTHKKGLMQQLFPREGETQPRLRFPEFRGTGEWEVKTLGQLIEIASGQVDPKESPYCDFPQIGSDNIESQTGKLVNVKSAADKGVISGNYIFDENDILYSKIRPALNKVAAPAFKGICSADIYPIRPANGGLLQRYLLYLLLSQEFLDYAIRNSERGKIPKINRDAVVTYKALIPSPSEQQRIATCLTTLDDLITAATQKLEALKTHKRGLMQQLFPIEN